MRAGDYGKEPNSGSNQTSINLRGRSNQALNAWGATTAIIKCRLPIRACSLSGHRGNDRMRMKRFFHSGAVAEQRGTRVNRASGVAPGYPPIVERQKSFSELSNNETSANYIKKNNNSSLTCSESCLMLSNNLVIYSICSTNCHSFAYFLTFRSIVRSL